MPDVTNLRSSHSRRWLALLLGVVCLSLSACFASHAGPKTSTETGNPSMLDSNALALHVTTNEVHINGKPGAATPGGVAIEITNLTTGKVTSTKAAADGSFDARVDGSPDDAFVVRAGSGSTASAPVYVVRGMAAVGDGKDGALSCDQRDQLAGEQIAKAADDADTSCKVNADCVVAAATVSCHDNCGLALPVSKSGKATIDAAASSIERNLCSGFKADGCSVIALPCTPGSAGLPPVVSCQKGQCTYGAAACQFATSPGAPILLGCTEKIVLHESGDGLRAQPPPGSDCKGASFTLTLATRDLEWSICTPPNGNVSAAWTLDTGERVLSQTEFDSAHQALAAVTVLNGPGSCGEDKETVTLDVVTPKGTQTYTDSFYSCMPVTGVIYVDNIDGATSELIMLSHP